MTILEQSVQSLINAPNEDVRRRVGKGIFVEDVLEGKTPIKFEKKVPDRVSVSEADLPEINRLHIKNINIKEGALVEIDLEAAYEDFFPINPPDGRHASPRPNAVKPKALCTVFYKVSIKADKDGSILAAGATLYLVPSSLDEIYETDGVRDEN